LLLLCGLSACLAQPVVQGELHGQIKWQGQVHLRGDLLLAKGATLTIAPGTTVFFHPLDSAADELTESPYFPGSELIVRGQIIAVGTPQAPIHFKFIDPDGKAGSWGGVNIEESPRAVFEYCTFQQADSAIDARDSWVVVENSLFKNNLVGIRFHDTRMLIEKNLLENNGSAIRFHFGSPVICKNILRNNEKGLLISSEPRGYTIENNSFLDNSVYEVSLGEAVRKPVVLKNNYWGEHDQIKLAEKIYDGRLDERLGRVEYLPMRSLPDPDAGGPWNR